MRDGKREQRRKKGKEGEVVGEEELADQYCRECGEELTDILGLLDKELIKLGFPYRWWSQEVLQKPFPFTYNDWFEGIVQEINPKFYINDTDDVSLCGRRPLKPITEQQGKAQEHNPDVEVGDVIELIYMDDPWADIGPNDKRCCPQDLKVWGVLVKRF